MGTLAGELRDAVRTDELVALLAASSGFLERICAFEQLMAERLPIARCRVVLGTEAAATEPAAFEFSLPASGASGFVAFDGAARAFDEAERRELAGLVGVLAMALENARLCDEVERLAAHSSIDPLTGALNRRAFDERLRTEWRRALRDGTALAIALLDVDNLKTFNEAYGRERGDDCLRRVARAVAETDIRPGDFFARYGGGEFAIVMPGADENGALALCDRVRLAIAEGAVEHEGSQHGILTVSVGVAATVPQTGRAPSSLLYDADTALYRAKQAGRNRVAGEQSIWTTPLPQAHSVLPALPHGFVGRARESEELTAGHRLVTVTGPAGIGKTALALEIAHRTGDRASFVDLTHVERGDGVVERVANQLGIDHPTLDRLVGALRDRTRHERLFVVLDRCEHVLSGVAALTVALRDVEGLRIVATSREPLHVEHEWIVRLGPLPREDALAFFEHCAREVNPDLAYDRAGSEIMERLSARLDGVPLAIEVAARALRDFSFQELETNFESVNARVATGAVDAALASSYLLLSADEKRVFARLAVFPDDCTIEAVRSICGDRSGEIVYRLADKSLLTLDETREGTRLNLLGSTRAFAAARLRGLGEYDEAVIKHARYYAGLLPDESLCASPERLATIRIERANYEAAIARMAAMERYDLAGDLIAKLSVTYLRLLGSEDVFRRFIETGRRIGESGAPRDLRLRVLAIVTYAAYMIGDIPLMRRLTADLLLRAGGAADPYTLYAVTAVKYIAKIAVGEYDGLLADADHVIRVAEATGSPRLCATTFYNLAISGAEAGDDLERASLWVERGIEYARSGAEEMEHDLTLARATLAWRGGDEAAAAAAFAQVLRAVRGGAQPHIADLVAIKAANFELHCGNAEAALALLLDVLRMIRRTPMKRATVGALDAYLHAACLREKFDVARRLMLFVEGYRGASGLRRTPFAAANHAALLARYALDGERGSPDLADANQAFALALTI
ncbi:MAG TPA: diguanylate cyclase [Verrucomicrobiae bacterium]|nr:diguanylate cyclase [Verrucomicrobiae bacterium]